MTYQQAGRIAIFKRILGWTVFILASLSTLVSLLNFAYQYSKKLKGINAVMMDFFHVMMDMIRFNTPFLDIFWYNSPLPGVEKNLFSAANFMFLIIYFFIFIGLALQASGARMSRQVKYIQERLEDQMIIEQAKGNEGHSRETLESRVVVPNHRIFRQYFPLYFLPTIIAFSVYFLFRLLGQLITE